MYESVLLVSSQFGGLLELEQLLLWLERLLAHVADREGQPEAYHPQDAHCHQETRICIYVLYNKN